MAGPFVSFTHRGAKKLQGGASRISRRMAKSTEQTAKDIAEEILVGAQGLVPEHDGDLSRSGKTEEILDSKGTTIEISFGDGLQNPRAFVIEFYPKIMPPSWSEGVTFKPEGRGAGYLSKPTRTAERVFAVRLASNIRITLPKFPSV